MPHEPRDDKKKPEETRMTLRTSLLPMVILPKTKVPPKSDTSPQPPRQGKARRPRRHVGRILALIAATLVLVGGMAVWKIFDMGNWEKLDPDKLLNLQQTSLLYDRAGTLVTSLQGKENRTVVPLSQIPVHVQNAFIAAEDLRFYQHHGFDVIR
ncbi:MAG: transglycosylase domain-containing protein, partial [Clostridia bacterium]